MILRCNLPGGRLCIVEDRFKGPQIAMPHDLVEPLFGSDEGRGQPAHHHVSVLPMGHAAGLDAHSGAPLALLRGASCRLAGRQWHHSLNGGAAGYVDQVVAGQLALLDQTRDSNRSHGKCLISARISPRYGESHGFSPDTREEYYIQNGCDSLAKVGLSME